MELVIGFLFVLAIITVFFAIVEGEPIVLLFTFFLVLMMLICGAVNEDNTRPCIAESKVKSVQLGNRTYLYTLENGQLYQDYSLHQIGESVCYQK